MIIDSQERIYGSHPAGEGGEYETITLDSPLFSHRVRLLDTEIVVSDPEPNLVAYLRIPCAELVPKTGWDRPSQSDLRAMLGLEDLPGHGITLDDLGMEVLGGIGRVKKRKRADTGGLDKALGGLGMADPVETRGHPEDINFTRRGRWFAISTSQSVSAGSDIGTQMYQAFDRIACKSSNLRETFDKG